MSFFVLIFSYFALVIIKCLLAGSSKITLSCKLFEGLNDSHAIKNQVKLRHPKKRIGKWVILYVDTIHVSVLSET